MNYRVGLKAVEEPGQGAGILWQSSGQEWRLGPELGGSSTQAPRHQEFVWRPRVRLARALRTQWCIQGLSSFHASVFPLKLLTANLLCNYASVCGFTFLIFHGLCSCILLHLDNIFLIFSNELLSQVLIAVLFQARPWNTDVWKSWLSFTFSLGFMTVHVETLWVYF